MPTLSAIAEVGDVSIAFCRGARWRPCASWMARTAEPLLVDWLLDRSSLTARLRSVCPGGFAVRPLAQGYAPVRLNERHRLAIGLGHHAFVREVFLTCRGMPWVFARTVIPRDVAKGQLRALTRLGTRPLGEVLFSGRDLLRSDLELARLPLPQASRMAGSSHQDAAGLAIWGRRSLFLRSGQPLLVSEIFLPAFMRFLDHDSADIPQSQNP